MEKTLNREYVTLEWAVSVPTQKDLGPGSAYQLADALQAASYDEIARSVEVGALSGLTRTDAYSGDSYAFAELCEDAGPSEADGTSLVGVTFCAQESFAPEEIKALVTLCSPVLVGRAAELGLEVTFYRVKRVRTYTVIEQDYIENV